MRIETDVKLDFSDVLLKPKRSTIESRKDIELKRTFKFRYAIGEWTGIPIISSNMSSVTNPEVAEIMTNHNMLSCIPKNKEFDFSAVNAFPSIGLGPLRAINYQFSWVCLDVPNAYIQKAVDQVKRMREAFPSMVLIAGNVVSGSMVEELVLAGADIVKVGIGSGAACSTRIKTGVGMPQLSAVIECADAAHGLGGHIISDGGCTTPGDIVKAFSGGADLVMLGSMLAGHDENGEDFYGSSSERGATELSGERCSLCDGEGRYYAEGSLSSVLIDPCVYCKGTGKTGGLKDYRASEGWEIKLKPRGPLAATLQDITGGLRSACAYVGAKRLKDLPKCSTFIQVNRQANSSLWEDRV